MDINQITTTAVLTDLPDRDVLTVDGVGSPETPAFVAAIQALLSVRAALGGSYQPIEGSCAQLLYLGPDEDEAPSLAALYAFIEEQGLEPAGAHTEVYLNDPSFTPPADLRTILRVPVRTKG